MSDELFYLVGYDEGGTWESAGAGSTRRLVCNIEGGGKLAIWGSKRNGVNIDAVLAAGLPCVVRCAAVEPEAWAAEKYLHTHWVPEHVRLKAFKYVEMGHKP